MTTYSNDNEPLGQGDSRDAWQPARRKAFLNALQQTGNVAQAARAAKKSISGAYQLRRHDPEFAEAWDNAVSAALDELEAVVFDRIMNGVEKPVFYAGKQCGSVRQYSDTLAMFMLKARRPDVYGRVAGVIEQREPETGETAREQMTNRLRVLSERIAAAA